jgi:hypothetical protein
MNGYVEAGYIVVLGTLGIYGVALLTRERAARRRVGAASSTVAPQVVPTKPGELAQAGDVSVVTRRGVEDSGLGNDP